MAVAKKKIFRGLKKEKPLPNETKVASPFPVGIEISTGSLLLFGLEGALEGERPAQEKACLQLLKLGFCFLPRASTPLSNSALCRPRVHRHRDDEHACTTMIRRVSSECLVHWRGQIYWRLEFAEEVTGTEATNTRHSAATKTLLLQPLSSTSTPHTAPTASTPTAPAQLPPQALQLKPPLLHSRKAAQNADGYELLTLLSL